MDTLTQAPCVACVSRLYGSFTTVEIDGSTYRVCDHCLLDADGPGKFEGCRDDLPLALALYALRRDGAYDSELSDDSLSVARFERYLLIEDSQGFVEVREFAGSTTAQAEMDGYEDDGLGASEDDAWLSYQNGGIAVSFAGKHVGTYERESRARAAVSLAMRKQGYYPNVWLAGEHGPGIRRIDVW